MLRFLSEGLALFLLPFLAYGLLLVAQRRFPALRGLGPNGTFLHLAIAGLVLAIAGMLLLGVFGARYRGIYVPAHMENGRLVPGAMQ